MARMPHKGASSSSAVHSLETEKENAKWLQQWVEAHIVAAAEVDLLHVRSVETLLEGAPIAVAVVDEAAEEPYQRVRLQGSARIVSQRTVKDGTLYVVDHVLKA